MADPTQSNRGSWLRADPAQLDQFATELDELIHILERIRDRAEEAASFRPPSTDPATIRAADHLAGDAHGSADPPTPVAAIATTIDDLTKQVMAARLAARDYRAHQEEWTRRISEAGEPQ